MPQSRIWIDTLHDGLRVTLQMPLDQLELAYGHPLAKDPAALVAKEHDGLVRYVLQHLGARQGWSTLHPVLTVEGSGPTAELSAVVTLHPPTGGDPRTVSLWSDAIVHEVRTHRTEVFLRQDWSAGQAALPPKPIGELTFAQTELSISLPPSSTGASVLALWEEGLRHIAHGTDHLLFLLLLMVAAPLVIRRGRWAEALPGRTALTRVIWVVSAFTIGHLITLSLGSTGVISPPETAVEIGVALTIGLTGWHLVKPWLAQREALIAGAFGLVHGLAFSASLNGAGLTPWQHAQALLAFNLGVESMQLLVLGSTLLPLYLLAKHRPSLYATCRQITGMAALVIALCWVFERSHPGAWVSPALLEDPAPILPWALALLWAAALLSYAARRRVPYPLH